MDAARLDPAQRASDLEHARNEQFDLVVIGGGVVGAGVALDAATPRPLGRADRAARLGLGHLEPLLEADPRRPALPRAARLRPRPRGAARADADARPPLPASGAARAVPLPADHTRSGSASTSAPARCSTTPWPAAARCRATAICRAAACSRAFPALRGDRHGRRHPVLGRPGRRRAPHPGAGPHRAPARRRTSSRASAPTGCSRSRAPASPACERAASRRAATFTIRGRQVVNATGVWTDSVQSHVGRGRIHVRASKGIHLVVPRDRIHGDSGLILRDREERAVRDPLGDATGSSAPPTPTGTSTSPIPPRAGATSTTCSRRSTPCSPSRCATTTSKASTPACARCCGDERRDQQAVPRARASANPSPA